MSLKNICFIVIGPLETKIGKGHVSMNLTLRRLEGLINYINLIGLIYST